MLYQLSYTPPAPRRGHIARGAGEGKGRVGPWRITRSHLQAKMNMPGTARQRVTPGLRSLCWDPMKPLLAPLLLLTASSALAAVLAAQNYSNQVMKLSEIEQRSVMRRAILDGGQYCKQVLSTRQQGPYKNLVMWTAHCAQGGDYAIYIGPDGSAQVRPCADLAKLGLPTCQLPARARR